MNVTDLMRCPSNRVRLKAPVSPYTVAKELGHGGEAMVRRVYGHLGTVRHRSEFLEYRVEQFEKELSDVLPGLREDW